MNPAQFILALALAAWAVGRVLWLLEEQTRPQSPRDGGMPRGVIRPRSRLRVHHARIAPGVWFQVRSTPLAQVQHKFGPAFVWKWVRWEIEVAALTHYVNVYWWSERYAR